MDKPLLILAFNRPQHIKRLIDSLRPHAPQNIFVGVDGPRPNNKNDVEKVAQVLAEIAKIDWASSLELRIRENNLGLRLAVADAVTWVIEKYGEVIVVEDDVEVGPEFLTFMSQMLDENRNNLRVGHVSGYNLVPERGLTHPQNKYRLSLIPESYAWATWSRAWANYDSKMDWANRQSWKTLSLHLGSRLAGLVWKINFYDARMNHINTWAYRWVASLWQHNQYCISPNRNLVSYNGAKTGTHTKIPRLSRELQIETLAGLTDDLQFDSRADTWVQKISFRSSPIGVFRRILESVVLNILSRKESS